MRQNAEALQRERNAMALRDVSCVVLGGGGFLGVNLCRSLASCGARVRAFGRRRFFSSDLDGVEWCQGDFSDGAALAAAIGSCEIVFHLIHTNTPQSASLDAARDVQQNVVPSIALLEASRQRAVKRVVFVSSGGIIYGPAKDLPTPETAPTNPISAYGISKLAIEKYLALYEHLYGLSFRVLRVANAFGPYQLPIRNQGIIAALISGALRGQETEIWGDGSIVRDYVFADDIVDALHRAAVDQSDLRIFNIGSGQGRSVRDVIASIEAQLDKKLRIKAGPARPIDVPISVLATQRAKDTLGWQPATPFEQGLAATIDWWRRRE